MFSFSLSICCILPSVAAAETPPAIAEFVAGLAAFEERVLQAGSLRLQYERATCDKVTPGSILSGLVPAKWTVAYRGGKWYSQRRFTDLKETPELIIHADPKTHVAKEGYVIEWDQASKSAVLDHFNTGFNIFGGLYYARNLSLDAGKYIIQANGDGGNLAQIRKANADALDLPFLPDFLRDNQSHYRVLSARESIDGIDCWIVEWPGMDRFWIAPQLGYAIPRRIYCWGPGKPTRFEILNRDYREVEPGLWLPFTQIVDTYASVVADRKDIWGKVANRAEYRLAGVEFGAVPESLFTLPLPPGTYVLDMARGLRYTVSTDTTEPFSKAIADAKAGARWRPSGWIGLLAGILALVIIGAFYVRASKAR